MRNLVGWINTKSMKRIQNGKFKILDNGFPWVNCKKNYKIWKFSEIFVVFLELSSVLKRSNHDIRFQWTNPSDNWLVWINTKLILPWANREKKLRILKKFLRNRLFSWSFLVCWKERFHHRNWLVFVQHKFRNNEQRPHRPKTTGNVFNSLQFTSQKNNKIHTYFATFVVFLC